MLTIWNTMFEKRHSLVCIYLASSLALRIDSERKGLWLIIFFSSNKTIKDSFDCDRFKTGATKNLESYEITHFVEVKMLHPMIVLDGFLKLSVERYNWFISSEGQVQVRSLIHSNYERCAYCINISQFRWYRWSTVERGPRAATHICMHMHTCPCRQEEFFSRPVHVYVSTNVLVNKKHFSLLVRLYFCRLKSFFDSYRAFFCWIFDGSCTWIHRSDYCLLMIAYSLLNR